MADLLQFVGVKAITAVAVLAPLKPALDRGYLGEQTPFTTALLGIGVLAIANFLGPLLGALLSIYVLPGKPLSSFGPKGSWAVITGASDGIGKEFASQIASKGYNLILASRTKSKLEDVSSSIKFKYPNISTEILPIDFATATDKDYEKLRKICEDKHIAILINNVGQSHEIPVTFAETEKQEMDSIININIFATLRVTKIVLPFLQKHKKGLILTMGSMGGLTPVPLLATYSGSKAFLQQWSSSLAGELEPDGITVHFIHAYLITSAMSKIRRSSWVVPSERSFVKSTLAKIGQSGGSVGYAHSGSPYPSHGLASYAVIALLGVYSKALLGFNWVAHKDIRRRALRKREREAKKA